jgi:hypothetical protein
MVLGHDGREGCRAKRRIRLAEEVLQTEAQVRRERELQNFVSERCSLLQYPSSLSALDPKKEREKGKQKGRPNPFRPCACSISA